MKACPTMLPKRLNLRGGAGDFACLERTLGTFFSIGRMGRVVQVSDPPHLRDHRAPFKNHFPITSIAGLRHGVCEPSSGPPKPLLPTFHQYTPPNHGFP